jgi:hypothetical protein
MNEKDYPQLNLRSYLYEYSARMEREYKTRCLKHFGTGLLGVMRMSIINTAIHV